MTIPEEAFFVYKVLESNIWAKTLLSLSSTQPASRTDAAERMRRHRERRRDGLRCLIIELRETEIDALIRNGLLRSENRDDYESVQSALYVFLDHALGK